MINPKNSENALKMFQTEFETKHVISEKADMTEVDIKNKLTVKGNFDCYMNPTFFTMIGEIKMWAGNTIPQGWLLCDGSEVSKTTYPRLFAAIGNLWGTPSSSSKFKLPNFTGRVPAGYNANDTDPTETFGIVGYQGGARGAWRHSHPQIVTANNGSGAIRRDYSSDGACSVFPQGCNTGMTGSANNTLPTDKANMPPYAVVKYIICAR